MVSQYDIIIKNMSGQNLFFYAFQKQASFANSGATLSILSSSLAFGSLAPNDSSGAQLDFGFDAQNYVGAKSKTGETSAIQPIKLTTSTPSKSVDNYSVLTVCPLGLSSAYYQQDLDVGYFGVQVPSFSPSPVPELYCGCAAINQDGSITLSSFISPLPNSQVYCAPVATYYVKVGNVPVGQVITYETERSAKCDFTLGCRVIHVNYNNDGSFTTKGS